MHEFTYLDMGKKMKPDTIAVTTSSFDKAGKNLVKQIESKGYKVILNPYGRKMQPEESRSFLTYDVIGMIAGTEKLDDSLFSQLPNLKVIVRAGIGMDAVDIESARKRGIIVDNTPDGPVLAVAELTVGVFLSLLRRIPEADRNLRQNKWQALMGNLLSLKKIGLIGCGRIGKALVKLLRVFDCEIIVSDPAMSEDEAKKLGVSLKPLSELLKESDIVSLHLPYGPDSHHIIGAKEITLMKNDSFLVNLSRGGLIDEEALIDSLHSGTLAGAALDTYEHEPYDGPLCDMENVVLTSHMGSYAKESRIKMEKDSVEKLLKYLF